MGTHQNCLVETILMSTHNIGYRIEIMDLEYPQGLILALANSQNVSENKKLRVQSASLSHFFATSKKSS